MEIADTGVWARKDHPSIEPWFTTAVDSARIAMCDVVAMEILHSARSGDEFEAMETRMLGLPWLRIEPADWSRARAVYGVLARQGGGHQRRVQMQDLLIAACAERSGVAVVHYDSDYDTVAAITGQPTRWAAPKGSL
ncbi:MAG: PIN domain-containing protein [Candidatus Limnocylindria bacterium]